MIRMSLLTVVLAALWAVAPAAPSPSTTDAQRVVSPAAMVSDAPIAPEIPAGTAALPGIHIDGPANVDQEALVIEAIASFEQFGLEVPSALVRFGNAGADCSDHMGLFTPGKDQTIITVCSDLPFVITHELAHVWIHENFSDEAKQAYVEARELPTWRSRDHGWNDRGVEDAAFVMQQVLMFGEDRSTSTSWTERVEAFHLVLELADGASGSVA